MKNSRLVSRGLKRFLYSIKEDRSQKGVERWAQKCNLRVKWHRTSILIEGAGRRAPKETPVLALIQSLFQLFKSRSHYSTRWMPGHESHYTVNCLYSWHLCSSEQWTLVPPTLYLVSPSYPPVTTYRLVTSNSRVSSDNEYPVAIGELFNDRLRRGVLCTSHSTGFSLSEYRYRL